MFCGIKLVIHDPGMAGRVERLQPDTARLVVDPKTGELVKSTADLHGLRIVSHVGGRNELRGSLHYYANRGQHNADQFTHGRLCRTIEALSDLLEFNPASAKIEQLEAGVNLCLSANPLPQLIAYKSQPPDVRTFRGHGHERRWDWSEYYLKAYDKQLQYALPEPELRWEFGTHKMRFLARNGLRIETLADLKDPRRVEGFGPLLADLFADLTFDDLRDLDRLTNAERRFYERAATFQFWEAITDPERRRYARPRFDAIRVNYGADERERITEQIRQTWQDLLTAPGENSHVFTHPDKLGIPVFSPFKYIVNSWEYATPSIAPAVLPPRRVCRTCGADISDRKPEAVFCPQKQCRNTDSNPRNNLRRRVARALDAPLFNPSAVLRLSSEQVRLLAY